jgi:hypothetical protein
MYIVMDDIVSGEKLQLISGLTLGYLYDFNNPFILENSGNMEFVDFRCIREYNNPKIMFCYGHRIDELSLHIDKFQNPFVLLSHNSDFNITDCLCVNTILNCKKLVMWYSQNVEYIHKKIHFLPIGIANQMWEHGNLSIFENLKFVKKDRNVYMSFKVATNFEARSLCLNLLTPTIDFLPIIGPSENIKLLQRYKFCVCPEGNGLDTHRLWEALFVKTVPILLRSKFSENIQMTTKLPMILLDSWEELDVKKMPDYESFDFDVGRKYLSLLYYKSLIESRI